MKYYVLTEFACTSDDRKLYIGCRGIETDKNTALGSAFSYIFKKYTQNNNVVQVHNYYINEIGVGDIDFSFTTTDKPLKEQEDLLSDVKNRHIIRIELFEKIEEDKI